jgi:hypothetical protein
MGWYNVASQKTQFCIGFEAFTFTLINKCQRIQKGKIKMDNPEKLAPQGRQDEEDQSTNTTQYVLDTTTRKQAQTRHDPSHKQPGIYYIYMLIFLEYIGIYF